MLCFSGSAVPRARPAAARSEHPMRPSSPVAIAAVLLAGGLALAKTDPPKKEAAQPRWAHSYAEALDEMKERNCVLLATFHAEH